MENQPRAGRLLVASRGMLSIVRVTGRGTFKNAPALKRFASSAIEQGCSMLLIDMAECGGLDSTFMGVMAGLATRLKRVNGGRVVVANLSKKNCNLLSTLGLNRLVETHLEGDENGELAEALRVPLEQGEERDVAAREQVETMLMAHKELADTDEGNVARFADVIAFLEQDLHQLEGG